MKNSILLVMCCLLIFSACIKDEVDNNNEAIFTFIWNELDQNYGGFVPRNIDWPTAYTTYYPQAQQCTNADELWLVCTEMLNLLDDQHVSLYDVVKDKGFAAGKEFDELLAEKEFDIDLIKNTYLSTYELLPASGEEVVYGKINNTNIAYIHLPNFGYDGSNWHEEINIILQDFDDTEGLILDLRNNGGGSPLINRYVAARFYHTLELAFSIQTRNGPKHTDFDEPTYYHTNPEGSYQYIKPIVALTNHSTVSAGEEFLLLIQTQAHITVVGDTTSNAFSTQAFKKFMPNGWRLTLPNQLYLYPDGINSPEGIGIVPDVYIRNDSLDVQQGLDEVLEKGIEIF